MKIISPFKDYYDFVAHTYGGGDPKIVYNRKRIGEYEHGNSFSYTRSVEIPFQSEIKLNLGLKLKEIKSCYSHDGFVWLVVCGRPYPLVNSAENYFSKFNRDEKWEIFDVTKHAHLVEPKSTFMPDSEATVEVGVELPVLVELSKAVGHPVYIIDDIYSHRNIVQINGECPVLSQLGLAALYPPEQLYQDLSYFLVNKMKDSPDLAPASIVSNKEKIVQHGFDVKQSFRHRK